MSGLDLTSMAKALQSLNDAVSSWQSPADDGQPEGLRNTIRAGVIQNFEFCFELAVKMLRRGLRRHLHDAAIDALAWRDLIRVGAENGFIVDPRRWFEYREMRNITSHTYDRAKADRVLAVVPAFREDAAILLQRLQAGNDG